MDTVVNLIFKTVGGNKLDAAKQSIDKVNNAIQKTNGNLPTAEKGFTRMGNSAGKASGGVKKLGSAIANVLGPIIGVTSALAGIQKAISTTFERDVAEKRLENLAQTTGDYEYALAAAREAQEKFGFTLTQATQLFGDAQARIGTLGYNVAQVNEVFTGFNVIARQAGVNADDAAGAFTQLAQGMSAGALQGDELRSILERMPQLAKVLADEMGKPVTEIKELGAAGAITEDIIYRALSNSAKAAEELGDTLTPAQQAMNAFGQAAENAFNTIGELIEPIVVPAIVILANKLLDVRDAIKNNVDQFKEFARVALSIGAVVGVFKGIAAAVFAWTKATQALAAAKAVLMSLLNPIGIAKAVAAIGTGVLVYNKLGNEIDKAAKEAEKNTKATDETAKSLKELQDRLKETGKGTDELVNGVSKAKESIKGAAEFATRLAEAQKSAADEAVRAAEMSQVIKENNLKLLEAEFSLQKTLLDIQNEKAKRELENAKTFAAVEKAAEKIYQIAVKQAKLDYIISKSKIESAVSELKLKQTLVKATLSQAEAERAVLAAKGEATTKADVAIQKAKQQTQEVEKMVVAQGKIAELQKRQAGEIYKQTIEAAKLTKEQQIQEGKERISKQLNEAKTAELQKQVGVINQQNQALKQQAVQIRSLQIGQQTTQTVQGVSRGDLPKEISQKIIDSGTKFLGVQAATRESNRLREESRKAAEGLKMFEEQMNNTDKTYKEIMTSVRNTIGDSTKWIYKAAEEMYNKTKNLGSATDQAVNAMADTAAAATQQIKVLTKAETKAFNKRWGSGESYVNRYASGGYVNTPTRAMIGEGGEGEYIVPESKMYEAMQRFGRGQRGESVVPSSASVNVNWNGEMIQMDGKAYIEKSQMPGLIQTAVTETMNTLHRNARARAYAGI